MQIRSNLAVVGAKASKIKSAVLVAVLGFASAAQAALPSEATTAFTTLKTDGETLITNAWPVVAAITVGFVLIGLFKRAAAKV